MSGWNSKGQLGISSSHEFDGFFFRRIQFVEDQNKIETKHICFVAVSLGWDHSLAITDTGKLYSWGGNLCGQLGFRGDRKHDHIGKEHVCVPTLVTNYTDDDEAELGRLPKIVRVACGLRHSCILDEFGVVYTCGDGKYGQLGFDASNLVCAHQEQQKMMGSHKNQSFHFHKINPDHFEGEPVVDIVCGYRHTLVLSKSGRIYGFGWNEYGQLGSHPTVNTTKKNCIFSPVLISFPLAPTCDHIHLPTLSPSEAQVNPAKENQHAAVKICRIFSGWNHCLALCSHQCCLFSWGHQDYGQLGYLLPERQEEAEPEKKSVLETQVEKGLPRKLCNPYAKIIDISSRNQEPTPLFRQVSCGSQHNLALYGHHLYAWGWNEHGICGQEEAASRIWIPHRVELRGEQSKQLCEKTKDWKGENEDGACRIELIGCGYGFNIIFIRRSGKQ
eukprot:Sdes_comp20527_c0_seq3m15164